MVSDLFFYQLVLIALLWRCLMLHMLWPHKRASDCPMPSKPTLTPSTLQRTKTLCRPHS
jgi:hypothetical protein